MLPICLGRTRRISINQKTTRAQISKAANTLCSKRVDRLDCTNLVRLREVWVAGRGLVRDLVEGRKERGERKSVVRVWACGESEVLAVARMRKTKC
jgi:hypothetical protein